MLILSDNQINTLWKDGHVWTTGDKLAIQPASIDLTLGSQIWRAPASMLPGRDGIRSYLHHYDRLPDLGSYILERNCVYIIECRERLALTSDMAAQANPKSSSGRLDIFVRLLTEEGTRFDSVPAGYHGDLYVEVIPRSFPICVRRGDALNQLRFTVPASGHSEQIPVHVDLSRPISGYQAKRHGYAIDLAERTLDRDDFWESVTPRHGGLILDPEAFYILMSQESIAVHPHQCAELVAYDTGLGEYRCHYAGFIDPGFGYWEAGGAGSRLVLEVRGHDVPFFLRDGQEVATLKYMNLTSTPTQLYGLGIGSHYQGQGLKLSKHFR